MFLIPQCTGAQTAVGACVDGQRRTQLLRHGRKASGCEEEVQAARSHPTATDQTTATSEDADQVHGRHDAAGRRLLQEHGQARQESARARESEGAGAGRQAQDRTAPKAPLAARHAPEAQVP